jgi:hypothetical protein
MWNLIKWLLAKWALWRILLKTLGSLAFLIPIALILKFIGLSILKVLAVMGLPIFIVLAVIGLPFILVFVFGGLLIALLFAVLTLGFAALKIALPIILVIWIVRWLTRSRGDRPENDMTVREEPGPDAA